MTNLLSKESVFAAVLGAMALFATYVAQISSNACIALSFEQPRMPKCLIKED